MPAVKVTTKYPLFPTNCGLTTNVVIGLVLFVNVIVDGFDTLETVKFTWYLPSPRLVLVVYVIEGVAVWIIVTSLVTDIGQFLELVA